MKPAVVGDPILFTPVDWDERPLPGVVKYVHSDKLVDVEYMKDGRVFTERSVKLVSYKDRNSKQTSSFALAANDYEPTKEQIDAYEKAEHDRLAKEEKVK